MRNLYKQNNIFICKHDTHQHFSSKMSVYHILEDKKCYPYGCVYFKWKCKTLAKKKKCHRNFTTVGRHCFSCKYFYEEKIHQFPQLLVNQNEQKHFFEEYDEFCDWIASVENKQVFCEGTIHSVVPDFLINKNNGKLGLGLKGFLIIFKEGFINNQHFEDTFYLHLDSMHQNKVRLKEDDEIEFKAILKEKDGRIELVAPKQFNFFLRGKSKPLLRSDLLVSLNTATTFNKQPEKCKKCNFSVIPKFQNNSTGSNRVLICSKGIQEPDICLENIERKDLYSHSCENDKSNDVTCSRTL
jgi:hypothetical protein